MMIVMISGGIDLSIGAVIALAGMAAALVIRDRPSASVFAALAIGSGVGLACGLVSGFVIAKGRVLPLIATLGMMNVYRGLTYLIAGGAWVSAYQMNDSFKNLALGRCSAFPSLAWISLAIFALAFFFLKYTRAGRRVYAIGSNAEAAKVSGIGVDGVVVSAYAIMGAIAGLCGVLWVSKYASAQGDTASGYEMTVIAACVIGGVSVSGGGGKVPGVFLGASSWAS